MCKCRSRSKALRWKMRLEHSAECDKRKIIKNLSAEHRQSAAETILNRPIRRGQTAQRLQLCSR